MTIRAILVLALLLLASGCLLPQPRPLNETGVARPFPTNYNSSQPGPELSIDQLNTAGFQGAPITCTVADIQPGQNITVYMKDGNVRSEYASDAANGTYVTIIKGDTYFIKGGMNGTPFENCSWIAFNKSTFKSSGFDSKTPYGARVPTYASMPGIPACRAGGFGDDIFNTNGTVCDFGTVMAQAALSAFNVDCSQIQEDAARRECERQKASGNVT